MPDLDSLKRDKKNISETTWAYLAGMIDGEGYMDMMLRTNPSIRKSCKKGYSNEFKLNISGKSKEALISIQKDLGMGSIVKHKTNDFTKDPSYTLRFYHNDQRRILPKVIPYLRIKKEHAILLQETLDIMKNMPRGAEKDFLIAKNIRKFRSLRWLNIGTKCTLDRKDDPLINSILEQCALKE